MPLVSGSNPLAATNQYRQAPVKQRTSLNPQSYTITAVELGISYFLLDCRVRGLSQGTLDCYSCKLKDFLRFIGGCCISDVTTEDTREYLAGLRVRGCNSTALQRHY